MPYYTWRGVDITARVHKGASFARSPQELEQLLFSRHIALLAQQPALRFLYRRSIPLRSKIALFKQLSTLLQAGLLVPKALQVVMMQGENVYLKEIMYAIYAEVQEGHSLAQALQKYPEVFSPVMIRMAAVGEQTGSLAPALSALADYLDSLNTFAKKIKAALFLPLITLGFFACIASIMLLVIVPKFYELFQGLGQTIPTTTQWLLTMSTIMRSWWMLPISIGTVVMIFGALRAIKSAKTKPWLDANMLRLPFIGPIVRDMAIVHSTHSLAMLLDGGMHLVPALMVTAPIIGNIPMRTSFENVVNAVSAGAPLHTALEFYGEQFSQQELISLIAVGHETGNLGAMLAQISRIFQEKIERQLHIITLLIQPLLMLILGGLIMFVLVALYAPLFTMGHAI